MEKRTAVNLATSGVDSQPLWMNAPFLNSNSNSNSNSPPSSNLPKSQSFLELIGFEENKSEVRRSISTTTRYQPNNLFGPGTTSKSNKNDDKKGGDLIKKKLVDLLYNLSIKEGLELAKIKFIDLFECNGKKTVFIILEQPNEYLELPLDYDFSKDKVLRHQKIYQPLTDLISDYVDDLIKHFDTSSSLSFQDSPRSRSSSHIQQVKTSQRASSFIERNRSSSLWEKVNNFITEPNPQTQSSHYAKFLSLNQDEEGENGFANSILSSDETSPTIKRLVKIGYSCPICLSQVFLTNENEMNDHIDMCLTRVLLMEEERENLERSKENNSSSTPSSPAVSFKLSPSEASHSPTLDMIPKFNEVTLNEPKKPGLLRRISKKVLHAPSNTVVSKVPIKLGGTKISKPLPPYKKKKLEYWMKYQNRLNDLILERKNIISQKQDHIMLIRKQGARELFRFSTWANLNLTKCIRNLGIIKILSLELTIQTEECKIEAIEKKLADVLLVISKIQSGVPHISYYNNLVISPKELIQNLPANAFKVEQIKRFDKVKKNIIKNFEKIRKQSKQNLSFESRMNTLNHVLTNSKYDTVTGYLQFNTEFQRTINSLFRDQRTKEGKQIVSLFFALQNPKQVVTLENIADFIQQFTTNIEISYSVSVENYEVLEIYIQRMIFPQIFSYCWTICEGNPEEDQIFVDKIKKLKKVLWFQLPLDFQSLDDKPPNIINEKIVEELNEISWEIEPTDMIYVIQKVFRKLFQALQKGERRDLGADDMFPLFIYCIIQSDLSEPSRYIAYMESFLSESQKLAEAGYCLVTFKAAFQYIVHNIQI